MLRTAATTRNVQANRQADEAHILPPTDTSAPDLFDTCRELRTILRFLCVDACPKVILFSSPRVIIVEDTALLRRRTGSAKTKSGSTNLCKHSMSSASAARSRKKHLIVFSTSPHRVQAKSASVYLLPEYRKKQKSCD